MKKNKRINKDLERLLKIDTKMNCHKNGYHLGICYELDPIEWGLYKLNDPIEYFENNNKAIMTNETNTIDELEKYLKEHCEWNFERVFSKSMVVYACLWLIISIINCFVNSILLRHLIWGYFITIIVVETISVIINQHNLKVCKRKVEEAQKNLLEDLK